MGEVFVNADSVTVNNTTNKTFGYNAGDFEYTVGTNTNTGWGEWQPNKAVVLGHNTVNINYFNINEYRALDVRIYYEVYNTDGNLIKSDSIFTSRVDVGEGWNEYISIPTTRVSKIRFKLVSKRSSPYSKLSLRLSIFN